ncbi:MAG: peptide-methionine (S)-S-oxide reductase MsrA [Brumimicrobium sp.]|nr:peptide-methionine (S)-S-oxide reductase MsrA [Brumimicrobium sp.]
MQIRIFPLLLALVLAFGCNANSEPQEEISTSGEVSHSPDSKIETNAVAYFASGCFWCVEAIFESVKGVGDVVSGYSGGKKENATYAKVSAGLTDHAESVAVHYDSTKIDYPTLLKVFFGSHDPTQLNRQGPDVGKQYRSAIFYRNEKEKKLAQQYIDKLLKENVYPKITTEVVKFDGFYPAEDYHQNYKKKHPNDPYIKNVSNPRFDRFKEKFPELLKEKS